MNEGMAEELDGLESGFNRVKIPAGGATMFELPGDEADEPETMKEFSAVILFHHPILQYYKEKYTGGINPPDRGSFDGVNGEGDPGGACANCPRKDNAPVGIRSVIVAPEGLCFTLFRLFADRAARRGLLLPG